MDGAGLDLCGLCTRSGAKRPHGGRRCSNAAGRVDVSRDLGRRRSRDDATRLDRHRCGMGRGARVPSWTITPHADAVRARRRVATGRRVTRGCGRGDPARGAASSGVCGHSQLDSPFRAARRSVGRGTLRVLRLRSAEYVRCEGLSRLGDAGVRARIPCRLSSRRRRLDRCFGRCRAHRRAAWDAEHAIGDRMRGGRHRRADHVRDHRGRRRDARVSVRDAGLPAAGRAGGGRDRVRSASLRCNGDARGHAGGSRRVDVAAAGRARAQQPPLLARPRQAEPDVLFRWGRRGHVARCTRRLRSVHSRARDAWRRDGSHRGRPHPVPNRARHRRPARAERPLDREAVAELGARGARGQARRSSPVAAVVL